MSAGEFCLKQMAVAEKPRSVKMTNWQQAETRPSEKAVVSWEIYNNSVFSEHEIVRALQELRKKQVVKMFTRGSTVWWQLKC